MIAQDFIYWLNGFVELGGDKAQPTEDQWKMICDHLKLTMVKVTPGLGKQRIESDDLDIKKEIERINASLASINLQLMSKVDKYQQQYDWMRTFPGLTTNPDDINRAVTIC